MHSSRNVQWVEVRFTYRQLKKSSKVVLLNPEKLAFCKRQSQSGTRCFRSTPSRFEGLKKNHHRLQTIGSIVQSVGEEERIGEKLFLLFFLLFFIVMSQGYRLVHLVHRLNGSGIPGQGKPLKCFFKSRGVEIRRGGTTTYGIS